MTSQEIKRYMDVYKYNQVSDCRYESDSVGTPVLWDYSKLFDLINEAMILQSMRPKRKGEHYEAIESLKQFAVKCMEAQPMLFNPDTLYEFTSYRTDYYLDRRHVDLVYKYNHCIDKLLESLQYIQSLNQFIQ